MRKLFILSLLLALSTSACITNKSDDQKDLSLEEAKVKATEFINEYLMGEGQEVSIKETVEDRGLYKVVVNMPNGQEVNSYLSKDGEVFFPSAMNISEVESESQGDTASSPEQEVEIVKAETPSVELFVMSHCPFGTQMEKGILPVLDTLGDKIDFELKFVDYAMHEKKELDEQLSQYCIQKNNPEKLNEYLYCFLEDDQGEECLAEVGINKARHDACVAEADEEFKVTELYDDKSTWRSGRFPVFNINADDNQKYGISGSPALVINGSQVSSQRDSKSLLNTICKGFENAPEECSTELSSAAPSPGFGFAGTGSNVDASCGS